MKSFSLSDTLLQNKMCESEKAGSEFFFSPPLSDLGIIKLQNLLMTPAIHHIKTRDMEMGRFLMHTFLDSLKHYHCVGYFSFAKMETLNKKLFKFLNFQKGQNIAEFIESFFIENPQVDFAWIESTQDLKKEISLCELENLCKVLTAHGQMPVVIMSYQENG